MATFIAVFLFLLGGIFIIKGGDIFVSAASAVAETLKMPKFIIGATVVSFATTLPEFIVSLIAANDRKVSFAVGNAVGSVTANTGLIMAVSMITAPTFISRKRDSVKCIIAILSSITLFISSLGGTFSYIGAFLLFILLGAFIFDNIKNAKLTSWDNSKRKVRLNDILLLVLGSAGIIIGADLLVDNAVSLARLFHISESVISATIVAIGTSLPELATAISAAAKGQSEISFGNIIGANIIDTALILPACSVVAGKAIPISMQNIFADMPACILLSCVAFIPALIKGKFSRLQGIIVLLMYCIYIIYITFFKFV